jgi:hypothetical protein
LKVDAGSRNLLRGLDILVVVDNCREGGIFLGELRMDFGNNPFGARFPALLRKLEAGGVLLSKDGISGGFFLSAAPPPLSSFLAC